MSVSERNALNASGIEVDTAGASGRESIAFKNAVGLAKSEFPGMVRTDPVSSSLGYVTIANAGRELEPDSSKPSRILPRVDRQLAWVMVFDQVDIPLVGTFNEGRENLPEVGPSRMVVLVDAETGKFIHARTF